MKEISYGRLAEMWCELNCHSKPEELKKFSDGYFIFGAMKFIESLVGKKAIKNAWKIYIGKAQVAARKEGK